MLSDFAVIVRATEKQYADVASEVKRLEDLLDQNAQDFPTLMALGRTLWSYAFNDKTAADLADVLATAQRDSGMVRLQLQMADDGGFAAMLPWEYLCVPEDVIQAHPETDWAEPAFLAAHPHIQIQRRPPQTTSKPLGVRKFGGKDAKGGVRVLLVTAAPLGHEILGIENQIERVTRTLNEIVPESNPDVQPLRNATPEELERALTGDNPPDIVHFICHGTRPEDEKAGAGLILDDGAGRLSPDRAERDDGPGRPVFVSAGQIKGWCAKARPQAVILNVCWGAARTEEQTSIAELLLSGEAPVPIVVAMQFRLHQNEAQEITTQLYRRLAQGQTCELALQRYRRAFAERDMLGDPRWGVPLVYTHVPDTALFEPTVMQEDPFLGLIAHYRLGFVPRTQLKKEVDDYVISPNGKILLLLAEGGLGKSAFLANWVEAGGHLGTQYNFYRYASYDNPLACAHRFAEELRSRYESMPAPTRRTTGAAPTEYQLYADACDDLALLLDELSGRLSSGELSEAEPVSAKDRAQVLVVDGLDEARRPEFALPISDNLLGKLPPSIAVIAAARPEWLDTWMKRYPGRTPQDTFLIHDLEAGSAENIAVVEEYLRSRTNRFNAGFTGQDISRIAAKAKHNFVVVNILSGMVNEHTHPGEFRTFVESTHGDVVNAAYRLYFHHLSDLAAPNIEHCDPVLALFATAKDEVSERLLKRVLANYLDCSEDTAADVLRYGMRYLRRFLLSRVFRAGSQEIVYEPGHPTFAEYGRSLLT